MLRATGPRCLRFPGDGEGARRDAYIEWFRSTKVEDVDVRVVKELVRIRGRREASAGGALEG
jgi:hypothetical protein